MSEERIPPGYYTPETLPPLSEEARKVLASVAAGVARLRAERGEGDGSRIEIEEGAIGIRLSDEGLPGLSLDDLDRWRLASKANTEPPGGVHLPRW